jgi:hypothetical protein
VSAYKRLIVLAALATVMFLGSTRVTEAQYRHGGVVVVGVGGGYYGSAYGLYDPWYGYEGQWGYPYPYPPPYRYRAVIADASVRIEVTPKEAEVYVDGYYAGIVDDFDGVFQRLHTRPGAHEIELYLDGFRTVKQNVYLPVNDTFKIKYTMERLAAGEQPEPRPQPADQPAGQEAGYPPPPQAGYPPQQGGYPPPQGYPPPPQGSYPPDGRAPVGRRMQPQDAPRPGQTSVYGTLSVRVQPGDAEVSIDGEQWHGANQGDRVVVEVAEGSHTIEIRKSGYRTYVTQVDIHHGQTTPLNVSLRSQGQQ